VTNLVVDGRALRVADVVRFGSGSARVEIDGDVRRIVQRARAVVDRQRALGVPVYGLTTALGSKVSTRVDPTGSASREHDVVTGRLVGVGDPIPHEIARSAMLIRLHGLGRGAAGVSPGVLDALERMLNAGIVVRAPRTGSIGASDLAQGAALAGALIGVGSVWLGGEVHDAHEALRLAGLSPVTLAPKDALGVINSSAFSFAHAAHVVSAGRDMITAALVVAVAAADAFGVHPGVYSPRVQALRPLPHAENIARAVSGLLEGSWVHGGVTVPQQAISFRAIVPHFASTVGALERFTNALEGEINAVGDNPVVLLEADDMSSSSHFHTIDLALQGDAMSLSLHHWVESGVQRVQRLINHRDGAMPPLLARGDDGATGLNPLQKTLGDLRARMRHLANPASLDALVVSDQVEDLASQLPLVVDKIDRQLHVFRRVLAIEAFVALQAHALRATSARGRASLLLESVFPELEVPYADGVPIGDVLDRMIVRMDDVATAAQAEIGRWWPSSPLCNIDE
jgi:histidine ammonia-lyase